MNEDRNHVCQRSGVQRNEKRPFPTPGLFIHDDKNGDARGVQQDKYEKNAIESEKANRA